MARDVDGVAAIGVIGGHLAMILVPVKQLDLVAACLSEGAGKGESGGTGTNNGNIDGHRSFSWKFSEDCFIGLGP